MKVSNKIKKLLFIAIIFLVNYVVVEFEPKPLSVFTAIKDEYNLMSMSYEDMNQNFVMKKYYIDMEKELLDEKNNLKLLNCLKQEEILKVLHSYLSSCNINLTKLNFSEELPVSLNNPMDETIVVIEENDDPRILMLNVNIEFNSNYENMLIFIDGLQNNPIDMSITNMNATLSEGNTVFVSMDINFYAISDI